MYGFTLSLRDMFTSPLARISDALKRVNDQVEDLGSNVDQMSNNSGSKLGGLIGVVTRLGAAFVTFESVKALFNIGVQAEQTRIKFEVLLGSAAKGKALLDQLNQYAGFTPYSNDGITKAAETMLGFGISQEKIMPNMRMLGDIAQGNEQKLESLSLVYSQIQSTGKLMGQDLLQLIGQGFNPLQIISERTGLSMGFLKDQMEKGAISSDMVSAAFQIATSEGGRFFGGMEKMSASAGGKWSTFLGNLQENVKKVGERFATSLIPIIDFADRGMAYLVARGKEVIQFITPFVRSLIDIVTWITNSRPLLIFLAGVMIALGLNFIVANAGAVAFSLTLGILNGVIWLVNAATAAWNFVLSMNPISLVIIAIAALVAAVVYLWKKFDWFRGGVMGVWGVLKGLGDMIKNYVIGRVQELLKAIGTVGDALNALKNGEFSKALDLGKSALGGLVGIESAKDLGKNIGNKFNAGFAEGVAMGAPVTPKGKKTGAPKLPGGPAVDGSVFNSLLGGGTGTAGTGKGKAGSGAKDKVGEKAASIVGGGAKQTTFNITIGKLQDQTVIHVDQTEKGINNLGDKVQEILLRAVNSVNQMQTT